MIEDVKKRYIDVPGNSPVTEEDFSLLEKKYDCAFPEDFKRFYREYNDDDFKK